MPAAQQQVRWDALREGGKGAARTVSQKHASAAAHNAVTWCMEWMPWRAKCGGLAEHWRSVLKQMCQEEGNAQCYVCYLGVLKAVRKRCPIHQ